MNVFGPVYKYRLDILRNSSYEIRNKLFILTDKISYDLFYKDFHNDYNFVMIEDLKDKYELSQEHELIPNVFSDESDQFARLESYYRDKGKLYVYDLHRYIFPFFIEKNIKKFFIIDSDLILRNDEKMIETFFETLPEKSIFAPNMGFDHDLPTKQKFWNSLNIDELSKDFFINEKVPFYDGWTKGFNFESISDMEFFFNLWNTSYLNFLNQANKNTIIGSGPTSEGATIWSTEWIFTHCAFIFKKLKGYSLNDDIAQQPGHIYLKIPGLPYKIIGTHTPRPEDNLYSMITHRRGAWYDFVFNYDDTKTISGFIKNNKEELKRYYNHYLFDVNITDTHAYTRIHP